MDIPAGEFKAKCLKLMEQVARTGEPITITKRGRPVAKLVPPDEPASRGPLFGYMSGTGEVRGDIERLDEEWAALSGEEDGLYDIGRQPAVYRVEETRSKRRRK